MYRDPLTGPILKKLTYFNVHFWEDLYEFAWRKEDKEERKEGH